MSGFKDLTNEEAAEMTRQLNELAQVIAAITLKMERHGINNH